MKPPLLPYRIWTILLPVIAAILIRWFWIFPFSVTDNNLTPHLVKGDIIAVDKMAEWTRGDYLVYKNPLIEGWNPLSAGKCKALPGDTLYLYMTWQQNNKPQNRLLPFIIPRKGIPVKVEPWTTHLLSNALFLYEGRNICQQCDSILVVNGIPLNSVTFTQDYIWISSSGKNDSATGSTAFGLLPASMVVGKVKWKTLESSKNKKPFFSRLFQAIDK